MTPAAAAQPGAGAAVAAGPAAAAGPSAKVAQAYGKTWVQRPSGLWEEAPAAAAAAAAPAAFPAAAAGPRAAAAGPGAGAGAAVAAGPAAAAGPQRRRGVAGPPQGPLWDGAVPAPAVAAPRAGPGPGSAGSAGPADAAAAGPAVADGPYDLAFFQGIQKFSANYQQHNAALKWFRLRLENIANPDVDNVWLFSNTEPTPVAEIVKGAGMDYNFDDNRFHIWSWFEMVAQLDAESMAFVVNGADGRSCGLVSCSFALRPNSYDHKRHHQLRLAGTPKKDAQLRVGDFVLTRVDGSEVRLHPQWSKTAVESYAVEGHAEEVEIPAHGLGESDGPGTYRHFKDLGTQRRLKFDGTKRPR